MISLHFVLILLAFFSEVIAAIGIPCRVNLTALGLAFFFLDLLIAGGAR